MFFPIGDDNSGRHSFPLIVFAFIGLNALLWFLQLSSGEAFTNGFSAVPLELTRNTDLVGTQYLQLQGQQYPLNHYPGPSPIHLTLFSSMFMHGSWMHILGNMLYLYIFGDQIEDLLGKFRFILFYLLCGIAAGLAQVLYNPQSVVPCLGASGAIAGVLGAYLVKFPRNGVRVLFFRMITRLPAFIVLGAWILLQFVSQVSVQGAGEASGVAYMAHIGGFVAGVVLIFFFALGRNRARARIEAEHPMAGLLGGGRKRRSIFG